MKVACTDFCQKFSLARNIGMGMSGVFPSAWKYTEILASQHAVKFAGAKGSVLDAAGENLWREGVRGSFSSGSFF